jgi:hypothetical protein
MPPFMATQRGGQVQERCVSPKHWVIDGYTVSFIKRHGWRIYIDRDYFTIVVKTLPRAREVLEEISEVHHRQ